MECLMGVVSSVSSQEQSNIVRFRFMFATVGQDKAIVGQGATSELRDLWIDALGGGLDDPSCDALDPFDFTRIVRNPNLRIMENLGIRLKAPLLVPGKRGPIPTDDDGYRDWWRSLRQRCRRVGS